MRIASIILLFIISLNALAAGYSFIVDPTGSGVGISTDYLEESAPFDDFLVPGMLLFVAIGLSCCATAIYVMMKRPNYPVFILLQGLVLIGWIAIQLTMVNTVHVLHYIIAAGGLALFVMGLLLRTSDIKKRTVR